MKTIEDWQSLPKNATQAMLDVLEFGKTQAVHNTYLNLLAIAPTPLAQWDGRESSVSSHPARQRHAGSATDDGEAISEDLKQLKALALAAMQGQWEMVDQGGQFGLRVYSGYQGFFNKHRPNAKCTEEVTHTCKFIGAADPQTVLALIERIEALTATQAPSAAVVRADEQALLNARAEGRAEAVLIITSTEPEDALNDCMVGSGPCPASGEYNTHWDEEKLRIKFKTGDSTINMETKAELAYYEYVEARMVLQYEAEQRRAAPMPPQPLSTLAQQVAGVEGSS